MLRRNIAVVIVAALVLGVGAYAWAQEPPADPTVEHRESAPTDEQRRRLGQRRHQPAVPLGRAFHGDLLVTGRDGEVREVTFDRGEVTEASEDSVTIVRPDGTELTFGITEDTRVRSADGDDVPDAGAPAVVVTDGPETKAVLQGHGYRHTRRGAQRGQGPTDGAAGADGEGA